MTERDLQRALLEHSKLIVATPGRYSLPGWESVQKALEFLKAAARLGDARAGPLRKLLVSAGMKG